MTGIRVAWPVLLGVVLFAHAAAAQRLEPSQTLRGLPGLHVVVAELREGARELGLDRTLIRTAIETKLTKGGIRILAEDEWVEHPAAPYLWVHVHHLSAVGLADLIAFDVTIELRQTVGVWGGGRTDAITLQTGFLGIVGSALAGDAIREQIDQQMDQIVGAWRTANLRGAPRTL